MKSSFEIKNLISKFDKNLENIIQEDIPVLKQIKKFVITSGGKRIRPVTHYLFCKFLNVNLRENSWLDVGSVAELIHAASLLHDDVVDNASIRRGKPTVGAKFGNKTAILAGDYLLACGISRLNLLKLPEIMEIFTKVLRELSVSELLQMEWEKIPKITLKIYNSIIYGKTASLFGACTESSAVLAGLVGKQRTEILDYGIRLGLLFQKKDDCLDYFTESKESGKEFLKDFYNGLYTYPILILRERASSSDKKVLSNLLSKESRSSLDAQTILELMEKYQIQSHLNLELQKEREYLMNFLNRFENSKEKTLFLEQLTKLG